jgi:hypothetical protein
LRDARPTMPGAPLGARVPLRRIAEAMLPAPAIAGETVAARTREAASPSPRTAPDDDAAQTRARLQDGSSREVSARPAPPQQDESATSTFAAPHRTARQTPIGAAETAIADHQPAAVDPALQRERAMPPQPTGFLLVGSDDFETSPSPDRSMLSAVVRPAARAERSTASDGGSAVLRADPPGSRLPGADAAAVDSSALDNPSMSPQPSADGQPAARPRAEAPVLPSEAGRRGHNLERLDKRGTDSEAPIRVSIGRITVEPPAASTRPPPFQRPRPTLSLNDYLARRRKSE